MSLGVMFVVALLIAGLMVRRLLVPRRHEARYGSAVHAVMQHVVSQGTINRRQTQALLAISERDAVSYLSRMERDGLIRRHGHDGYKTFYTRV